MMSQGWMGSDFSNKDISKSTDILEQYDHNLISQEDADGHTVYVIEAIPHEDAPVVWGKEQMVIRDDFVLISQTYFDQDMQPLKKLQSLEIGELGGRMMATRMRMVDLEQPEQYTEVAYEEMDFDVELEDKLFTVFALQSGSRR